MSPIDLPAISDLDNDGDLDILTFEITGVDRIGFVGTTADVRCYAACSTF